MMDETPKLFRLPGTIEEEEEEEQQKGTESNKTKELLDTAVESPLLSQKGSILSTLPKNVTLIRVSTQTSSIAGGIGRQDSTRSRYRAGPTRKLRRRAVLKNGDCNVLQSRISRRSLRFLQDIFTTLVDTQWRWTLLCFMLSFLLSWLGFAVIWWLIAFTHGDFEEIHLPPFQVENNWTPCVYNIFSFTSCFLFSIETQHTIGYGSRSTTEECPEAIFIMCLQSIAGVMIQAFMVGIVFAKMTRPKQRTQTLLFSRNAVICQRDGELCLMFRVGDMRKSHIIGASVRAQMIRSKTTKEGEVLSQHQHELVVGTDGDNGNLFFIWPATIIHQINEASPFYNMSAEDMLTERFEVVLILEGTIESTGQTTQARSSYLPQEILWGHRFDPMVSYSKERQGYEVDYSVFNSTTQVDTPLCSGRELTEFYKAQDELRHGTDVLIDEDHLMRRGCECDCHLTNHQRLQLSLTPFEYANSHNSTENEYYWQNICKCSNCISYEPQTTTIIDQSKMFDFDAIQVMEHEELQQLPEAVNREIVKNSEEIVYDEEEKVSERNLIKLNDVKSKFLSYNHFLEEKEEDVLIQKAVEKDTINKEDKEDNQKSIEGEKEAASMQTTLIRLNKDKGSQKVSFKKEKRDFSENYMIRLKEKMTDILKNSQEVIYDDTKDGFLKRNIICGKDTDKLKNCQEVKQAEELLERKLAKLEGNGDTMKNHHIYNKEQLIKVKENPKEIRHLIGHIPYKPKDEYKTKSNEFVRKDYEVCLEKRRKLHNKKCQLIMLVDRDQKNIEKNPENIFMGKERRSQKKFDRSLSDDLLTVSDKRSFKKSLRNRNNNKLIQSINQDNKNSESDPFLIKEDTSSKKYHRTFSDYFVTDDRKENAISNMKNIRILEKEEKSLQQISKYSVASLDHLNSNSISDQQLNFNSLRWENDDSHYQMKQHDHIRIENERIQRKSSCRRSPKIAMQDKFYSNDIRSLNSPVYDFSSESGFCEQNSESNCRELFTRNMKDIENVNSVKSNLSRENIISDIDNPKECIKNHSVEAITNTNIIRNDEIASSYFSLPSKNFVVDGNNLMKYTDSSLIKEQIICIENEEQNIHEAKKKNRCPRRLSRKVISNFYESKKPSSIVEKQLIRNKCIQNIDEEFTTQKSDFLNVDVSPKYFVRDNECPEWFDDTIIVERQIDHDITRNSQRRNGDLSSNNISCENVVNDSVVPKHLKQYNSSILTEEQVYGNKMEDRKQICNSSNSNTSYKNFINNTVTLDSRQCDDDFIPENQVVYESERNDDDDMTSTKTTTDCFV